MTTHDDALELAATALDFPLDHEEALALSAHLAACVPCRRQAMAIEADRRAIGGLPVHALDPDRVERIRRRVSSERRGEVPVLRLVAIAAMLTLLAISALAVGSRLLRSDAPDLSVGPTQPPIASAAPAASALPDASPGPDGSGEPAPPSSGTFAVGAVLDVVVSGLRVRTAPTVDNAVSAKLEPLLGLGTRLQVIDGPVEADDYHWYLVQAVGLPHRGWVAAADHDGEAWIDLPEATATATLPLSADETALVGRIRQDAAVDCHPRRTDLPVDALAGIECEVSGGPVQRVGVYRFPDAQGAARTYLARMAANGVTPMTGDCRAGTVGDAAWSTSGERIVEPAGSLDVGRIGCYIDENGTANVRLTCDAVYVGLLGRDGDVAALTDWAWWSPDGPVAAAEAPGICAARS